MSKKEITNTQVVALIKKEIGGVREEIGGIREEVGIVREEVKSVEERLTKKIEDESSFVAGVAKRGFDDAEIKNKLAHKKLQLKVKDIALNTNQITSQQRAEAEHNVRQDLKIGQIETRVEVLERQI